MEFEPRRVEGDAKVIRNRWLKQAWGLVRRKLTMMLVACGVYAGAIELIDYHGNPSFDDPWGLLTWLAMILAICATAPWFMAAVMSTAYAADHGRSAHALWRDLFVGASRPVIAAVSWRAMLVYGGILCGAQVALAAVAEFVLVPADPTEPVPPPIEPDGLLAWVIIGLAEHVWYAVLASPLAIALAELFTIPILMRAETDRDHATRLSALGVQRNLLPIRRCYVGLPLMLMAALLPGVITILGFGFASVVIYVAYRDIFEARAESLPERSTTAQLSASSSPG